MLCINTKRKKHQKNAKLSSFFFLFFKNNPPLLQTEIYLQVCTHRHTQRHRCYVLICENMALRGEVKGATVALGGHADCVR